MQDICPSKLSLAPANLLDVCVGVEVGVEVGDDELEVGAAVVVVGVKTGKEVTGSGGVVNLMTLSGGQLESLS